MRQSDPRVHITIAGAPEDPRAQHDPDGVVLHRVPSLHPDDIVTLPNGLRVTSVARTLIDLAEDLSPDELRDVCITAHERGLLDLAALRAARARVEWRPSLDIVDTIIADLDAVDD